MEEGRCKKEDGRWKKEDVRSKILEVRDGSFSLLFYLVNENFNETPKS